MKQSLQIMGSTRIFAKEVNGKTLYSTSISNKNIKGEWEKMYIAVQFPKNTTIPNKTDITILESFISFYKNNNGLAMPKIVVQKFEIEEEDIQQNSDLPF